MSPPSPLLAKSLTLCMGVAFPPTGTHTSWENLIYSFEWFVLQGSGEDCGGLSDCEELVGVTWISSDSVKD